MVLTICLRAPPEPSGLLLFVLWFLYIELLSALTVQARHGAPWWATPGGTERKLLVVLCLVSDQTARMWTVKGHRLAFQIPGLAEERLLFLFWEILLLFIAPQSQATPLPHSPSEPS